LTDGLAAGWMIMAAFYRGGPPGRVCVVSI